MADQPDDKHRQVVPRWRPFRVAAALGELSSAVQNRPAHSLEPAPGELEELIRDWANNKNPFHASSLVDAALVLGRSELATEAAEWLIRNGGVSGVAIDLAKQVLGHETNPPHEVSHVPNQQRHLTIAHFRQHLRQVPRNPLLWVDLAREYSILGELAAARKALLTGITLAPNNRFVLRSASRFFMHVREFDLAHNILLRAPSISRDPWLLSAEIVAAQLSKKQSRLVKRGYALLDSGQFHPHHLSELASAIGTLEHEAGDRRQVRRLFAKALIDPTENSVAQAAWVGRHMHSFELASTSLKAPRAFEASAWDAVGNQDYRRAVNLSEQWLSDEPFSARPAFFGSWVASTALGDYRLAERMVAQARVANPSNPGVTAQLLYCKASAGDIDGAEALWPELERNIKTNGANRSIAEWNVLLKADRGLIAYRRGRLEEGRMYYQLAIDIARTNRLHQSEASAFINYTREQVRANPKAQVDSDSLIRAVDVFPLATRGAEMSFVRRILETPRALASLL